MQRKLFIIRHGKSSWESIVNDIDRPLIERGVNDAYDMARRLENARLVPEMIISSPAIRALHTAMIMAKVWNLADNRIHINRNLYLPEIDTIAELLFGIDDKVTSLAIFGHNPGFTHFANRFLKQEIENLPTAGAAVITMEMEKWNDLFDAKIIECLVDFPKNK